MSCFLFLQISNLTCCSVAQSCLTLWDPRDCSMPGSSVLHDLPVCSNSCIESVMTPNHLILCSPLLLLPSILPSTRVFSNESALRIRWPKYWSFSLSSSLSNEYSGLISFRIDWFNLLAVQETLKSLLQHHSWKASILWLLASIMVQLLHLYKTTGKTIALTIWTFVGKMMSSFNTLPTYFHRHSANFLQQRFRV